MLLTVSVTEVWAQLWLSSSDCTRIRDLLADENLVKPSSIIPKMHLTVYHCRRPMTGLTPLDEGAHVVIPTAGTRFMVLAPGGENPRPELEPRRCKVGIRIQRTNTARAQILDYRERLLSHETPNVLGGRPPSNMTRNAFGARSFQPHIALVRPGSRIDRDLTKTGALFRANIDHLTLDRFTIDIVRKDRNGIESAASRITGRPNRGNCAGRSRGLRPDDAPLGE